LAELKEHGMQVSELPPEEMDKLRGKVKLLNDELAKARGGKI